MYRYFFLVVLCAASIFTSQVQAAQRERLIMAYTIVELSGVANMMMNLFSTVLKPHMKRIKKSSKNSTEARAFANIFKEEFNKSKDDIKLEMAKIYVRHLTDSELRAALRFYKSPAGRSLIAKQPILYAEGEKMGGKWMKKVLAQTLVRFKAAYGGKYH